MTKELRGIIEKMVSENPDIMQIATDWSPSNIGTTIWVQFPSIEDQELANQFMEKYTDYVNDLFTPDYMYDDSHTLVFPQLERFPKIHSFRSSVNRNVCKVDCYAEK